MDISNAKRSLFIKVSLYDVTTIEFNSQSNSSIICCRYYAHGIRLKGVFDFVHYYIIAVDVALEDLDGRERSKEK